MDIIGTWLTRNNYPIVHIRRETFIGMLTISQSQDEYYIDDEGAKQVSRHWLPITFTTWEQLDFNNTTPYHWITPKRTEIPVPTPHDGWIIVNLQQAGYYRVRYDYDSLHLIAKYLKSKDYNKIHVLNRAQLVDDTYYFMLREEVP
ncbi:membrane alanyl aminopeptidase [Ooceraea biroi]|uniref:membrane alanyl aminopeptidase n=1 Tax=Ooceraea biroi TaxID=2015173 RepID=UPI000F07CDF1|nr:membrane alanyl aminopeptidase [Ooceraea biroi]